MPTLQLEYVCRAVYGPTKTEPDMFTFLHHDRVHACKVNSDKLLCGKKLNEMWIIVGNDVTDTSWDVTCPGCKKALRALQKKETDK